jgi:glycosidase
MTKFAPVGNGRVLAYVFGEDLRYVRGTNIVQAGDTRFAAVEDEIVARDVDLPPLAGATRATVVDRIPDLHDREATSDVYARSVLVIALHQELAGGFIASPDDDVLLAYALDACGERGAAEAFYQWALNHRRLDGLLMWGLGEHVKRVYRSLLIEPYERLKNGPGLEVAAEPPGLPKDPAAWVQDALPRRNELDLFTTPDGIDLRAHALFLICVHELVPRTRWNEDSFFTFQATVQDLHRARALYGGAFHAGLTELGDDPREEVEVRADLEPSAVVVRAAGRRRYKLHVATRAENLWASDSDPRPGGQEFAFGDSRVRPPDWLADAVVYQVMVDRFARADGPVSNQDSPTALYGGTLDGVRTHLDHIASIGCNTIWLTPVHKSPSHHGYDHEDYYTVEPRYGGEAALKRLIEAAHARGMRVLLDFVPNHTGRGHHLFRAAVERGGEAAAFYRFWQWPHYYRCFFDDVTLPELDTGSRRVQDYLVKAAQHWVTEYGADGVRCDHVAGVDPAFWVELRRGLRAVKPDALVLGEATGHSDWLARYAGRIDAIFNFDLAYAIRQTFATGRMDLAEFGRQLDASDAAYRSMVQATLLDNHDMPRFLGKAGGDVGRLMLAATLLMTLPGMPVVYYGTEVGLSQAPAGATEDVGARMPMLWGKDQDAELLAFFQRLGRLRAASPALRRGSRRTLHADARELVYERVLGDERIVVSLNLATLTGQVRDGAGRDRLLEDEELGVGPDQGPR